MRGKLRVQWHPNQSALQQTVQILNTNASLIGRQEALTNLKCSTGINFWARNSYRSLSIRLQWEEDSNRLFVHRTYAFHNFVINSRVVRMDGMRYTRGDCENVWVADSVLQNRRVKCQQFFWCRKWWVSSQMTGTRKWWSAMGTFSYAMSLVRKAMFIWI